MHLSMLVLSYSNFHRRPHMDVVCCQRDHSAKCGVGLLGLTRDYRVEIQAYVWSLVFLQYITVDARQNCELQGEFSRH
jgi:hypothetical protein